MDGEVSKTASHDQRVMIAMATSLAEIGEALELPQDVLENPTGNEEILAAIAQLKALAAPSAGAEAVAWTVYDAKGIRFTLYSRELAEAIAERGLLMLPMLGRYEWLDAKVDTWKPINRLPYTWERELGIQWRAALAGPRT